MSLYADLGVRTVINASGALTRLGGTRMEPEVLAAMAEAAASFVRIDDLQARAGEIIAEITGAEAGYVVTGAAAGLSLGVAACIAGMDVGKMDRLPIGEDNLPYRPGDKRFMKDEVVVQRGHRNAYDHAIRATGAKFVEVGYLAYPGAGGTFAWQIEEAISERTAAIACPIIATPGTVSLREVTAIGRKYNVPVIVDAAASLPPRTNLRRFIEEGADLVTYSGGKAIRGPQASGVLAGRKDLIASVALQHQDMDVREETWAKRALLERGDIQGIPHQGFGRSMKVGREEIVGLITALRRFAAGSDDGDKVRWHAQLDHLEPMLANIPHVVVERIDSPRQAIPTIHLQLDEQALGKTAYDVSNLLLDGKPSIAISENRAEYGTLIVNPHSIDDAEIEVVGRRLVEALRKA
jgi:D-glucosaminate-6-phosphate ammonia-lyase